jgi:predicted lipoprotein with Yx(FWY)xxD motif
LRNPDPAFDPYSGQTIVPGRKERMQRRKTITATIVATAVVIAIAATAAVALTGGSSSSRAVVKTGHALGKNVLVTRRGMTLYSLSAEHNGRFICTDSTCMSLWKPLVVARGTKPTGAAHLATVRRPGGQLQVTYRGLPLYTFVKDTKPGQAKGEGFKDVGTWHVASTGNANTKAPAQMPSQGYGSY